jgi:hypothetical protein
MDQDIPTDPVERLRDALNATVADIPKLEAAVTAAQATVTTAQERLRRQMAAAEKMRDALSLLEADAPPTGEKQQYKFADIEPQAPSSTRVGQFAIDHAMPKDIADGMSKKAKMVNAVTGLLRMRGSVHRKVILQHLMDAGIMGHESDPLAHLAAFLSSNREKFASDGAGNFSLRQQSVAPEMHPDPATGEGDARVGDAGLASARPDFNVEHEKGGVLHEPAAQR